MFRLPAYQDLSPDQEVVFDLPEEGRYLISGPPGTGKTVLAMLRASVLLQRAREEAEAAPPVFLVYNNVLRQYLQQATQQLGISSTISTVHGFLPDWYRRQFQTEIPRRAAAGDGWFQFDWQRIFQALDTLPLNAPPPIDQLLIDEGQDLSPEFYQVVNYIARHVTVFADDNQTLLQPGQSATLAMIAATLGIGATDQVELTTNFRNSHPIAMLAAEFYAGAASGTPTPPTRVGPMPKLIRYASLAAQADAILLYEQARPRAYIGVIAETHDTLNEVEDRLTGRTTHPVRRFIANSERWRVDFHRPGVFLLTYRSVKGLEFDTVFLPAVDRWRNGNPAEIRHLMSTFVQTSRPRHELRVLYSDAAPPIFANVPAALLTRHESTLPIAGLAQ